MRALVLVLKWAVLLPVMLAVVLISVANDQPTTVHLNPFDAADPVLRAELPLYQIGFLVFVVGALVGAVVALATRRSPGAAEGRLRSAEAAGRAKPGAYAAQPRSAGASAAPPAAVAAYLPRPERS